VVLGECGARGVGYLGTLALGVAGPGPGAKQSALVGTWAEAARADRLVLRR